MSALLYLHGFNSSPQSKKAIQTKQWLALNAPDIKFLCPSLPPFGIAALKMLQSIVEDHLPEPVFVVGSSMGGFFATCLIEQYNLRGVLINPVVSPARGLDHWLGENANYVTGEKWVFEEKHIDEFRQIDPSHVNHLANYLVLLQTGDEVLDCRDAQARYTGAKIILEQGGDHGFIDYDQHLVAIHQFLISDLTTN
jgi:predicted esterase YcpF (UPF0227 family)